MANYPDTIDSITKARLRLSTFGSIFSIALTMFFIGAMKKTVRQSTVSFIVFGGLLRMGKRIGR